MIRIGRAVFDGGQPLGAVDPANGGGAFGTERTLVDGAARVALDMDDAVVFGIDQLGAADGAIGANAGADLVGFLQARAPLAGGLGFGCLRHWVLAAEPLGHRPATQRLTHTRGSTAWSKRHAGTPLPLRSPVVRAATP